jgi:hypothetical protein
MNPEIKSLFDVAELNSLFTTEELEIQSSVRDFANEQLRPKVAEWYMNSSTPTRELMRE